MAILPASSEIASRKRLFQNWENQASVRSAPIRVLRASEGSLPFAPELLPIVNDSRVKERGPGVGYFILALKLLNYLSWTALLEAEAVMPICKAIGFRNIPWPLHPETALEGLKIHTDEAHHTFFSEYTRHQAIILTGVRPGKDRSPLFMAELARSQAGRNRRARLLTLLMFVCVSETLISKSLMKIPADLRVIKGVRLMVDDHARDESRHRLFFSDILVSVWQRLSPRERDHYGPMLATWIEVFLSPDYANEAGWLEAAGFAPGESHAIVRETYEAIDYSAVCREAAGPMLLLLKKHGITDNSATYDAFAKRRLIPESYSPPTP